MNIMANANPAHEEVWDDSALLTSWNDAFAEYKVKPCFQSSQHLTC